MVLLTCGCASHATTIRDGKKVPSCMIHMCTEVMEEEPELLHREAKCHCGKIKPSNPDRLAFFEYRGKESPTALTMCECGYFEVAHKKENHHIKCKQFKARGPMRYDSFYCGCDGWN